MDAHGVNPAWWFPDAGDAGSTTSTFVGFARARTACATAAGGYWECVGNVSWPAVEGAVTTLETVVANAISPGTLAGMDVWACATNDVPCNNPWGHDQTDAQGRISLTIRRLPGADATGYLKVTSSTTVPTYFYWGFPLTHARYVEGPGRSGIGTSGVSFITSMANQSLSALDGGSSNRATVLVFVEDCLASAAAGVGVTLTPADPGIVVLDLQLQQTDPITPASGVLVFLNVPAGRVKVTATPAAIGKPSGEVGIYVRAGSFTSVLLRPTPM
jgi:hypothetical protein